MQIIRFIAIFLAFCFAVAVVNQGFEQAWPGSFEEKNTGADLFRGCLTLLAGSLRESFLRRSGGTPTNYKV